MKKHHHILCILLSITLLLSFSVVPARAESDGSASLNNPLYTTSSILEEEASSSTNVRVYAAEAQTAYASIDDAAAQLRDYMRARTTDFTLYVYAPNCSGNKAAMTELISQQLIPTACSEELAVGTNSGDYLAWSWINVKFEWIGTATSRCYTITMHFSYYTTAQQEQELADALGQVVQDLNLWTVSDYKKYLGLYQYVTNHVDYATEELEAGEKSVFSAYSAMFSGRAVCQGYATLFYALCRSMNLPVRTVNGTDHAWNLVQLGELWYAVDATWDGSGTVSTLNYFLKGTNHFTDHEAVSRYQTAEFTSAYPMSAVDYTPTAEDDLPVCPFRDISQSDYYYDAVNTLSQRGLVNGVERYCFAPDMTTSRAMLVTILWRLEGSPEVSGSVFCDVPSDAYYTTAVAWAYQNKITLGVSSDHFDPDAPLTRQQLVTFLYRYASYLGCNTASSSSLNQFEDVDSVDDYAKSAMNWAVGAKIVQGFEDRTLRPGGEATRGQLATMLFRFLSFYQL